jgi:pimeloyl-ACP methyl ester carboxylesterase
MATFEHGDVELHYEDHGHGFPVLLIAPGGMRSELGLWERAPWNPIEVLAPHYRVIAMDQRNAGRSTAPVRATDSWHVYTEDQLALLDHLGVDRFHVAGMCIGGSYGLALARAVPDRVASAVLFQPIGLDGNRAAFFDMFDGWADELRPSRPDTPAEAWTAFRDAMYGSDFVFSVTTEDVAACTTPLLVLRGDDLYHPAVTSETIARIAPNATLVPRWKDADSVATGRDAVVRFLAEHTPG